LNRSALPNVIDDESQARQTGRETYRHRYVPDNDQLTGRTTMASLREKLAARATPYLQPGEQVQQVYMAQGGPSPYWSFLTYLIYFAVKPRIIVVTNSRILVLPAGRMSPSKPTAESNAAVLPRQTPLGPVSGLWAATNVNGEKLWVHKRFQKDVIAADAAIGYRQPA
jgi:hypothetical protein